MWNSSWTWSIPLIVSTVIIHVIGLGLFNVKMVQILTDAKARPHFTSIFAVGIAATAIWAIFLHATEAGIWAAAYWLLGALPDGAAAMLYSLSAITTYGHSQIFLADHWRLLGALEALNGVILIGLTTALMYGLIQRVLAGRQQNPAAQALGKSRRHSDASPAMTAPPIGVAGSLSSQGG